MTVRAPVGSIALAHSSIALGRGVCAFRNPKISRDFLYQVLILAESRWEALAQGSTFTAANALEVASFLICYPESKAEQLAIAELLTSTDSLIEGLDKLIAKKRAMRQGVMQQLLTGRTRLPGFSGEWELLNLGDIASFLKGFGLPKSALDPSQTHPCIHYGELFTNYSFRIAKVFSRTNARNAKVLANPNDVLMPTSDVTPTGLAVASAVEDRGIAIGGDVLIIRPNSALLSGAFLASVIRFSRQEVLSLVTGSTVYHIYASEMKKFSLLVPPIEEQRAIVEILSDIDAEIDAVVTRRDKTVLIKTGMMQELLTGRTRLL